MSARIHSRNVQESHQKFYHKSPREFTYFLYKSSPFMTMRILPPYAQWSTLVLDGHFWILFNHFKFRLLWPWDMHWDITKCVSSAEGWFKMFWLLKMSILGQNFWTSLHKITNFRDISGHQWTIPNDSFSKKNHWKCFCSC